MFLGFPGGSDGKESSCKTGDLGSIPGLGRSPGGGHDSPLQYSCLENPHGQRSLVSYGLRGHKELDMTERLSRAQAQFSFERLSRLLSKALGLLFLGPVSRLWAAKFWVSPSAHPIPWNFN